MAATLETTRPLATVLSSNRGQAECLIQACFHDSPYPALRGIQCTVRGGVAQLDGALPSFYLKQLAQEIVKQLNAVEQVANRIKVVAAY